MTADLTPAEWLEYMCELRDDGNLSEYGRGALAAYQSVVKHLEVADTTGKATTERIRARVDEFYRSGVGVLGRRRLMEILDEETRR